MTELEQQARKEAEKRYPPDRYTWSTRTAVRSTQQKIRVGAYAAALVSERSKPSIMVRFSEEEIQRIVTDSIPPSAHVGLALTHEGAVAMARTFMEVGLRYANTRTVSIDKIMEVVEGWSAYSKVTENDPEGFGDLRDRLNNLKP